MNVVIAENVRGYRMAAGKVHVKKQCGICQKLMKPSDITLTIPFKIPHHIEHKTACRECYERHYSQGEQ